MSRLLRVGFGTSLYFSKYISPVRLRQSGLPVFALFIAMAALAACTPAIPTQQVATPNPDQASDERLSSLDGYTIPTPVPAVVPDATAVVITEGSRANVRLAPGLDSPVVAKADPGATYQVLGKSADGEWWQICCVRSPDDAEDESTLSAWLAAVVVEIEGDAESIPVVETILPDDLEARWQVDWLCGGERCNSKQCAATVTAEAVGTSSGQWLEVEHNVTWDQACEEDEFWVFEVDRYSAQERTGEYLDNFLYNYWPGQQPGEPTNAYTLDNGRKVAVNCSGPHESESPATGGWTIVFRGNICHDIRTGTLVSRTYTMRWLFTGEYEGQQYERAYFGDYGIVYQHLINTNAELTYIDN